MSFSGKTLRHNSSPFLSKELQKGIMTRLRLENKYSQVGDDLSVPLP